MTKKEINEIKQILIEVANIQSISQFKNMELSRRERIKERHSYLLKKCELLSKEEHSELDFLNYLIEIYYVKNPL